MKIFLIRHGETPWTKEKRYQGTTDIPLNREGLRQAKAIARTLKREGVTRIFTSTLRRAKETGRALAGALRIRPFVDPRLNEICFGLWEGAYYQNLFNRKGSKFKKWREGNLKKPPGGESLVSLTRRIRQFLRELLRSCKEETVAIVSHGGPIKTFLFQALYGGKRCAAVPLPSIWALRIDPASISLIEGDSHLLQIVSTNRRDHLFSR